MATSTLHSVNETEILKSLVRRGAVQDLFTPAHAMDARAGNTSPLKQSISKHRQTGGNAAVSAEDQEA